MHYYYNHDGENKGPVSLQELHALAQQGSISGKTPVIEEGGAQWKRYAELGGSPAPAPANRPLLARLLSVNESVDRTLGKFLKLPSCLPSDESRRRELLARWNGIMALVVWAGFVLVGFAMGSAVEGTGVPLLGTVAGGFVLGFIVQYIYYQFYGLTSSIIFGQRIVLSSMGAARLLAALSVVVLLFMIYLTFTASGLPNMLLYLIYGLMSLAMAYFLFNADEFIVSVRPGCVSPGRELNNFIRLILRAFFMSLHVLAPAAIALSAIALVALLSGEGGFKALMSASAHLVIIGLPLLTFFGLCLSSWAFDLLDGIFSLGEPKER